MDVTQEAEFKLAKRTTIIMTFLYLLLYPFLLGFASISLFVFDNNSITCLYAGMVILFFFGVPFSIPLCLYFAWKKIAQQKLRSSYYWLFAPFAYAILLIIVGFCENLLIHSR